MNSLQNIMNLHGEAYTKPRTLPSNILKALYSIRDCRTAALGRHVYECDECGETKISYNSCRNRHCPKCQAYAKEMWIYERSKAPFSSAEYVLQYLGRYTHRVAISDNRIIKVDNEKIVFKWRDYKDKNKEKVMSLKTSEFIRRFTMHILPDRFVKIRHYGILANRNKNLKLKRCKEIFRIKPKEIENLSSAELFFKLTGIKIGKCKTCEKGNLIKISKIMPLSTSPP